jgi:glycosyltransferase involved in cell wall biosynthesis
MNQLPLFSIITIVLNNVKYIEKTIINYLEQNCLDSELVIIDGGSKDGTLEIIKKYGELHSNIHWISEKDEGQSDAMNKGLQIAKGEYVSFLNSDDYYEENALNTAKDILQKNKNIDFLIGNCNVWNQYNQLEYTNKPLRPTTTNLLIGRYIPVNPAAYFYRKSIHEKVGGYKLTNHYNMDIEFLLLASRQTKLVHIPIVFGNFRLLPEAKTGSDSIAGLLEKRKKELFDTYKKKFGWKIQLQMFLLKAQLKANSQFIYLLKKIADKIKYEYKKHIIKNNK